MPNSISVAVIGSGYWGKNLVRNYHQLGVLKTICDRNETVLAQFKAQYPDVETCLAYSDILKREDIQGVAIATPAETHFALAREALLDGKHVYVEKPLVLNEKEGEQLIELAEKNKRTLMVGHLLQYHPVFLKLKELAASGELGRINYIYSHRLNLGKIRREENILWSFAPHDISMILSLAGEQPESVLATGGNYLHRKIADVTTTHLEFPSGLKAHIFVSWLHPFKVQQMVVVGERKMAVFDDTQPWSEKLLLYPHQITWQNQIPVSAKGDPVRIEVPQAEPLRQECEQFLLCIARECRPVTDGREGLRVLRILNASQRSLDQNGRKIRVDDRIMAEGPGASFPAELAEKENGVYPYHPCQKKEVLVFSPPTSNLQPPTFDPSVFIHPTAIIDDGCEIGQGTKIWHFSHLLSGSRIGQNCTIGQNAMIGPDVTIGNQCKIQNNVSIYKGVTLEDGVFCGPAMVFTNIYNPRAEISKMDQVRPTLVKRGATLGANSTIICGLTIGRYAFIGAGAVVTRDVPDYVLMMGNPAKQAGWMCQCGERLGKGLNCEVCGKQYKKSAEGLKPVSVQAQ